MDYGRFGLVRECRVIWQCVGLNEWFCGLVRWRVDCELRGVGIWGGGYFVLLCGGVFVL